MRHKHWDDCTWDEKIERWERAALVLKNLTPHEKRKHFDMATWGDKTECGTVACAAGHCGMNPWFRRRGFILKFFRASVWDDESSEYISGWDSTFPQLTPTQFFGRWGTESIFHNSSPRSVSKVIKEIKQYIRDLKDDKRDYGTVVSA